MALTTFTSGQVLTAAQLNAVQANDYNQTVSTKTASYTLVAADKGTRVVMNVATANTVTVNTSLFSAGDTLVIQNIGAGVTTVTAGTATVSSAGPLAIPTNGSGTLYFTSAGVSIFYPSAGPAATSALTLITAQPITASSSFQVNGCFSATYDNYLVKMFLSTYVNATQLRFGTSGTPNTGSIYQTMYGVFRNPTSPNTNVNGSNNQTKFGLTVENDAPVFYNIEIYNPFATASTGIISSTASGLSVNGSVSRGNYGGGVNGTTSFTDIVIIPDSGTIDGYIKIYGYQNS